jgi:hypothetical protein
MDYLRPRRQNIPKSLFFANLSLGCGKELRFLQESELRAQKMTGPIRVWIRNPKIFLEVCDNFYTR